MPSTILFSAAAAGYEAYKAAAGYNSCPLSCLHCHLESRSLIRAWAKYRSHYFITDLEKASSSFIFHACIQKCVYGYLLELKLFWCLKRSNDTMVILWTEEICCHASPNFAARSTPCVQPSDLWWLMNSCYISSVGSNDQVCWNGVSRHQVRSAPSRLCETHRQTRT